MKTLIAIFALVVITGLLITRLWVPANPHPAPKDNGPITEIQNLSRDQIIKIGDTYLESSQKNIYTSSLTRFQLEQAKVHYLRAQLTKEEK